VAILGGEEMVTKKEKQHATKSSSGAKGKVQQSESQGEKRGGMRASSGGRSKGGGQPGGGQTGGQGSAAKNE
jgi:hypothetical protein